MSGGQLSFGSQDSDNLGAGYTIDTGTTVLSANTWYHVAVDRVGTTLRVYLNGVVEATNSSHSDRLISAYDLIIGAHDGLNNLFKGYMEELRILKGTAAYQGAFTPRAAFYKEIVSAGNWDYRCEAHTAASAPSSAYILLLIDNTDATINTDLTVKLSLNDGTNMSAAQALTFSHAYDATLDIYKTGSIDVSGETAGTDILLEVEALNSKTVGVGGYFIGIGV